MKKKPTVKDIEAKCKDYEDCLKRLQAEFDNYRKREEKMKIELSQYATAAFINKLLPFIDSMEAAAKDNKAMEQLQKQLSDILGSVGLRPIGGVGHKADPYKHEVILTENSKDKDDNIILEEIQRGYMLGEKVLRHAKVKVTKVEE